MTILGVLVNQGREINQRMRLNDQGLKAGQDAFRPAQGLAGKI